MNEEKKNCINCEHRHVSHNVYPCEKCEGYRSPSPSYWMPKLPDPTPKGIDIIMVCGEMLHVDTVQPEIETVTLNGEQVYPTIDNKGENADHETLKEEHIHFKHDWWNGYVVDVERNGLEEAFEKLKQTHSGDSMGSLVFIYSVEKDRLGYKD